MARLGGRWALQLQIGDTTAARRARPSCEAFAVWLPTVRLPVGFDVTRETIPAESYLHADPDRTRKFRRRLDFPGRLRVGSLTLDPLGSEIVDFADMAAILTHFLARCLQR